jgi:Protein of unknown function (DUF2490)
MRKALLLLVFLIIVSRSVKAQNSADVTDDVQFWPDLTVRLNITKKSSVDFFGTARLGQNLSHFVAEQLGIATAYRPSQYLTLTANYRAVWGQPLPGKSSFENRIFFDATPRLLLKNGITLTDRNRIEFREINHQRSTRYRNRYQVEKAIKWDEKSFTPYVSGEIYYDSRYHEWGRKQLWTGVRVPLKAHLTCDFTYMHNWDARAKPGYWNTFGVLTRIEF